MSDARDSAPDRASAVRSRHESLLERFEEACFRGERPRLDDYLPPEGADRRHTLVELIRIEMEMRLKTGEGARVESYLERFPELARDTAALLDLLAWEYQLRRRQESG